MYGSVPCTDVTRGWCLMSHNQREMTDGSWTLGFRTGQFCKQMPKIILLLSDLTSDILLCSLLRARASTFENPHRTRDISGNNSVFFLLLTDSLSCYCLLWPFVSLTVSTQHDSGLLSCSDLRYLSSHHTKHNTLQTTQLFQKSGSPTTMTSLAPPAFLNPSHSIFL